MVYVSMNQEGHPQMQSVRLLGESEKSATASGWGTVTLINDTTPGSTLAELWGSWFADLCDGREQSFWNYKGRPPLARVG